MIKAMRLSLTALMLAVLPALAFAQKTTYDFDKDVNFASIHTYALKEGTPAGNPLIDKRLVEAIQSQLAAKGLKVDEANPDIWVVYHVSVDKKKELTGYTSGYGGYGGYGWRYGGGMTTTNMQVNEILVGDPDHRHGLGVGKGPGLAGRRSQGDRHRRKARQARQEHQQGG